MGHLKNKPCLASRDSDYTVPVLLMQSGNYFATRPQDLGAPDSLVTSYTIQKAIQLPTWK